VKGWHFLQTSKGRLIGQGVIVQEAAAGLWLCHFQSGETAHAEIIPAADMLQWQLFPDAEERQNYLSTMALAAADRAKVEGSTPPDPPPDPDAPPNDDLGEHGLEVVPPGKDEPPEPVPDDGANETSEKKGGDDE